MIDMIQKMRLAEQPSAAPSSPAAASPSAPTIEPARERAIKRFEQLVALYALTPEDPVVTSQQLKVIDAIKKSWPKDEEDGFEILLRKGEENTTAIEDLIVKQQKKYTTWLNSDEATKCFTEEPPPAATPPK